TARLGAVKLPVSLVVSVKALLVWFSVTVTFAPATTAPDWSVTVPDMSPRSDCANRVTAHKAIIAAASEKRTRRPLNICFIAFFRRLYLLASKTKLFRLYQIHFKACNRQLDI